MRRALLIGLALGIARVLVYLEAEKDYTRASSWWRYEAERYRRE